MKILLIGKNGQLGREIENNVLKSKHELLSLGRKELDITDYKSVEKIINSYRPQAVINTTAIHAIAEDHPEKLFAVNSFALHNLATKCNEMKIRLINYSTDYVFDGSKGKPYKEDDKENPLQMYGLSKYTGEIITLNYNPNAIIIRTCGVYGGVKGSRIKGNFVLNMLKEVKSTNSIEVSSEQIVSPTYAVDLAQASLKLIDKNPQGGIYHLVNSGYCSWVEFTQEIMNLKGMKVTIISVDRKGLSGGIKRPLFSALNNIKAAKLGVVLPSWQDALKRYINFLSN